MKFLEFSIGGPDQRLVLQREFFAKTEPGLSSYYADPKKGAKSIEDLLKKAKTFVPEELWSKTPLVLKATAGLRLLEPAESENLLEAVRDTFERSGFLVKDNSVEIMTGIDEGIYSWFAINILTGIFHFSLIAITHLISHAKITYVLRQFEESKNIGCT